MHVRCFGLPFGERRPTDCCLLTSLSDVMSNWSAWQGELFRSPAHLFMRSNKLLRINHKHACQLIWPATLKAWFTAAYWWRPAESRKFIFEAGGL